MNLKKVLLCTFLAILLIGMLSGCQSSCSVQLTNHTGTPITHLSLSPAAGADSSAAEESTSAAEAVVIVPETPIADGTGMALEIKGIAPEVLAQGVSVILYSGESAIGEAEIGSLSDGDALWFSLDGAALHVTGEAQYSTPAGYSDWIGVYYLDGKTDTSRLELKANGSWALLDAAGQEIAAGTKITAGEDASTLSLGAGDGTASALTVISPDVLFFARDGGIYLRIHTANP